MAKRLQVHTAAIYPDIIVIIFSFRLEALHLRKRQCRVSPAPDAQIPHILRNVRPVGLVEHHERVTARLGRYGRHGEMGPGERLLRNLKRVAVQNLGVFCIPADVVAGDAAIGELCVEEVGVAERRVGHHIVDYDTRVGPHADRVLGRRCDRCVQVFPHYIDVVV